MHYLIFFRGPYSNPLSICVHCGAAVAAAAARIPNSQAASTLPLFWPSLWHRMDLNA